MKFYQKILRISWTERKTNASVLEQLGVRAPQLLNLIRKQKLSYFGHIKRHNTVEKLFLEGTAFQMKIQQLSHVKARKITEFESVAAHSSRSRPRSRSSDDSRP